MKSTWPSGLGRQFFHFWRLQVRILVAAKIFFFPLAKISCFVRFINKVNNLLHTAMKTENWRKKKIKKILKEFPQAGLEPRISCTPVKSLYLLRHEGTSYSKPPPHLYLKC